MEDDACAELILTFETQDNCALLLFVFSILVFVYCVWRGVVFFLSSDQSKYLQLFCTETSQQVETNQTFPKISTAWRRRRQMKQNALNNSWIESLKEEKNGNSNKNKNISSVFPQVYVVTLHYYVPV